MLADGSYETGTHRVTFDAAHLAGGLYLLRGQITAGDQETRVVTQKLLRAT